MRLRALSTLFILALTVDGVVGEKSEVSDVRRVYKEVQAALSHATLVRRERRFDYCEPYEDASRDLYTSSSGVPRLYVREGGSDDSAVTSSYYYDDRGRLRFVFIKCGAVNGTQIEHRIWLAIDGRRIREQRKLLEGPGYTFPDPWPEESLVKDPQQAFSATHPCRPLTGE